MKLIFLKFGIGYVKGMSVDCKCFENFFCRLLKRLLW